MPELNSKILKVSGLTYDPEAFSEKEDIDSGWISFDNRGILNYRVLQSTSTGIYFTFPSRDWTMDMTITLGEKKSRWLGIRSGVLIKDGEIPVRVEKDSLYTLSLSIHVGNGTIVKNSFKLRNVFGLDFWFKRV
jgi:hypothetical protein